MERAELKTLLRATGCAIERGGFWFMGDPSAPASAPSNIEHQTSNIDSGWLCVPTGGTSGGVRFACHDERTLTAAADGFCDHFSLERVNAVGVLPPYHVSGLMARVRCAATGGEFIAWDWKKLEAGERPVPVWDRGAWMISLVPTQLQRLLGSADAVAWLRRFKIIFVGGGPVWPKLTDAAARAELPLSLSYGMTETTAMVTALRPEEFLAGARSSGPALPHARVSVDAEGVVTIAGASVFRGYFPEQSRAGEFRSEDLGRIDERGHLHVLGRRDAVIITGGRKVHPIEVEAALQASGQFSDVAVIGMPDEEWGQAIVACYPKASRAPDLARAVSGLKGPLRPKQFVALADWPRNAQGKLNRAVLLAQAAQMGQSGEQPTRSSPQ